ncbi:class I SAM-dependent methyltransferase [Streptomyces fumanus]|uniref:class I SAM-dependent methyltransferase n=1 Tax=Streptomyces fumanus TaxID=67302 RepID=UPI0033C99495
MTRIVAGGPGREVLDVGCGTGIAARQFQAAGLRRARRRAGRADGPVRAGARPAGRGGDVRSLAAGREFDAVIAAQSWHRVDPVAGADKAAEVLRPGGRRAVLGHVYEPPAVIAEPFAAACRR